MKSSLIILFMLVVSFSCGTNNKPVSDAQKEKIQGEVKEVVNTFITGCEEANFEKASPVWLNSPDFGFLVNGHIYNYEAVMGMKSSFDALINQKCTIIDEKYAVLDNSTVIYSANSKWEVNYKDGHSTIEEPEAIMILFRKNNDTWKAAYLVVSFTEKTVKYAQPSKEINQVELLKQFIGTWIVDNGKDTATVWVAKQYGTGMECYYNSVSKGKMLLDGKQIFGYSSKLDKFVAANVVRGNDIDLFALWFVSDKKYIITNYDEMSNVEEASIKVDGEFKSPTEYVETVTSKGKILHTYTYKRSN